jgi:hypothetical protein
MRKLHLHTYLREDGARIPYRVSAIGENLMPYHPDDRIEEGWFVTSDELEVIRQDAFEAARQTSFLWYKHDNFEAWVKQRRSLPCALESAMPKGKMIVGKRQGKRFLRRVKRLAKHGVALLKCGFCKRLAFPLLFAVPVVASAQTVPVSLVVATGEHSVTCEEGRRMFDDVKALYAPLGIDLRLRWFKCAPNPRKRATRLEGYGVDNAHWWYEEDYFTGRRYKGRRAIHYAILPPVQFQGALWIVGQAYESTCYWSGGKRVGISSALMSNAEGRPRYRHSVIAIAHEIGHMLGFSHDETLPVSIMHPGPLSSVDKSSTWLPWPQSALNKLKFCRERDQ